ncbi:MAG: RsmE family RNA methyltransferase [Chitinophagaceae bacterium]
MQLPFFYEEDLPKQHVLFTLNEDTSKHCVQVLRMKVGEQLQLTNGKGLLATASITTAHKKNTVVQILNIAATNPPLQQILIAISPLKNATRLEWFLEKATEIGVTKIQLIVCSRTEKQHIKFERYKSIVIAAMLQSQQTWMPILEQPIKFGSIFEYDTSTTKLIAHCVSGEQKFLISDIKLTNQSSILIGPEGDFTPLEIEAALVHQYKPISLGNTRLRTETAGVVAATLLKNGILV